MSLFRKVYKTMPLPPRAKKSTVKGKLFGTWKEDGKVIRAELTRDGKKYKVFLSRWYGRYQDKDGQPVIVRLFRDKLASEQKLSEVSRGIFCLPRNTEDDPPPSVSFSDPVMGEIVAHQSMPKAADERVYFLFDPLSREVKIGKTFGKPKDRLASLRCGNPRLQIIGHVKGSELDFHKRYASLRKDGEFFTLEGDLLEFLKVTFTKYDFKEPKKKYKAPPPSQDELGYPFDLVAKVSDSELLFPSFERSFGWPSSEGCVNTDGLDDIACSCKDCSLNAMIELIYGDFVTNVAFIEAEDYSVGKAFLFCKAWGSRKRTSILQRIGELADAVGMFDIFAVGCEHVIYDQHEYVWRLNDMSRDPMPRSEFFKLISELAGCRT